MGSPPVGIIPPVDSLTVKLSCGRSRLLFALWFIPKFGLMICPVYLATWGSLSLSTAGARLSASGFLGLKRVRCVCSVSLIVGSLPAGYFFRWSRLLFALLRSVSATVCSLADSSVLASLSARCILWLGARRWSVCILQAPTCGLACCLHSRCLQLELGRPYWLS